MVHFTEAFCRSSVDAKMKQLLKTIHICQSYSKNENGTFYVKTFKKFNFFLLRLLIA